jgi:hypothetical protein
MKKLSVIVLCIAIVLQGSLVFASIQAFKIGSGGTNAPDEVVTGFAAATTAEHYMTFEKPIGTDIQVTAGKTLYITKLRAIQSTGMNFNIGYGDTGVASGVTPPTNYVALITNLEAVGVDDEFELIIPIPAGKYPCIYTLPATGAAKVYLEGLEA